METSGRGRVESVTCGEHRWSSGKGETGGGERVDGTKEDRVSG